MADAQLQQLLQQSKLEHLSDLFKDAGVGIEMLSQMDEETLTGVVPNVLQRFVLKTNLKKMLAEEQSFRGQEQETFSIPSTKETDLIFFNDERIQSDDNNGHIVTSTPTPSNCSNITTCEISETGTPIIFDLTPVQETSRLKRTSPCLQSNSLDLKSLLESSCMGRAILLLYKSKGFLGAKEQGYLVDIITGHFLNGEYSRLDQKEQQNISRKIVELFPNEKEEVYFVPGVPKRNSRDNKSGRSKGKFADKYRNKITFLRSAGALPYVRNSGKASGSESSDESLTLTATNEASSSSNNDDAQWLKNNIEPWNLVQEKWFKTFKLRCNYLQKNVTITEILEEWPIIKQSLGYTLIDHDFSQQFGDKINIFLDWDVIFEKLATLRKGTLKETDALLLQVFKAGSNFSNDYRHYLTIQLLSALIPSTSRNKRKGTGKTNQCKPSATEAREGIIICVENPGDIETSIKKKAEKVKKVTSQELFYPFVVIDIEDDVNVNSVYISLGNIVYKVPSVLKALDVCFKIFHVLNLNYPEESEHLWLFIQWAVYKLESKYDKKIPSIVNLVNILKQM